MERDVGDLGGPISSDTAVSICCCIGKSEQSEERMAEG